MSWIVGYVGEHLTRPRRERLAALATDPVVERFGRTYYVAAGGLSETCAGGDLPDEQGHWCIVGTGVRLEADECRLLRPSEWRRRLSAKRPSLDRLGGGFVALRCSTRRVEVFSDVFGLRSLYWRRVDDGYFFSTRPEWLAAIEGGLRVDWEAVGSHWLAYNQLAHRSLVEGVDRLGPGGHVTLTDVAATLESRPYSPNPGDGRSRPRDLLSAQLRITDERILSLGLSGGMDSRTLLALRPDCDRFAVHVFGPKSREDVQVALSIAEEERLTFSHFHVPPSDSDTLLQVIRRHVIFAQAVSPASAALSLRYYPELRSQNKLVIDGGFGEIMRRQFMNRLLRRQADAVRSQDARRAFECVRFARADVFSAPVDSALREGALNDMSRLLEDTASWLELGLENAVDLINIRTRLPNFFGYEQARLDELAQNFMPFAHPKVIDAVFGISARRRRRGRLSRRIIAAYDPRLRRYPLVKSDVAYPYGLPSIAATLLVKLKKRLGGASESADRTLILSRLKPFIMDRIDAVSTHGAYDTTKLRKLAEEYFRDGVNGAQLDWWLALELWREAIEEPRSIVKT